MATTTTIVNTSARSRSPTANVRTAAQKQNDGKLEMGCGAFRVPDHASSGRSYRYQDHRIKRTTVIYSQLLLHDRDRKQQSYVLLRKMRD
jgi:hypothetical protein